MEENSFSFTCSHCPKSFELEKQLHIHVKQSHKKIECQICGGFFDGINNLIGHKRKMHKKNEKTAKQFECSVCPKKFRIKGDLTLHMSIIHEQKTRKTCPECGKLFFKTDLKDHLQNFHGIT